MLSSGGPAGLAAHLMKTHQAVMYVERLLPRALRQKHEVRVTAHLHRCTAGWLLHNWSLSPGIIGQWHDT